MKNILYILHEVLIKYISHQKESNYHRKYNIEIGKYRSDEKSKDKEIVMIRHQSPPKKLRLRLS